MTGTGSQNPARKRKRWDMAAPENTGGDPREAKNKKKQSRWDVDADVKEEESVEISIMLNEAQTKLPGQSNWTDEQLDRLLPSDGYVVIPSPHGDRNNGTSLQVRTSVPKDQQTAAEEGGFYIQRQQTAESYGLAGAETMGTVEDGSKTFLGSLPGLREGDDQFFAPLINYTKNADNLSPTDKLKRSILTALLQIKNGNTAERKVALRRLTTKAREWGPAAIFDQLLPLVMAQSAGDQCRHYLVKAVDRVLYSLDDLVRPYTKRILVAFQPMLMDKDPIVRTEGREMIAILAKAAGLTTMLVTLRPDVDKEDELVRAMAAQALAVTASALGTNSMIPFLKAVCHSQKRWEARHTGATVVRQLAFLTGFAVLSHLNELVEILVPLLDDDVPPVRIIAAHAISQLAKVCAPYGIESFELALEPLWNGIGRYRGKLLSSFIRAVGCLIPLMDAEYALYYTKQMMPILVREFKTPDEDMRGVLLTVVGHCCQVEGLEAVFVREQIIPKFFEHFWTRRTATTKRSTRTSLLETTVILGQVCSASDVCNYLVDGLTDGAEVYRLMVLEGVAKVLAEVASVDLEDRLQDRLVDGALFAYNECNDHNVHPLKHFSMILKSMGQRAGRHLQMICDNVLLRMNHKAASTRQQSAEMLVNLIPLMATCHKKLMLRHVGSVLNEYLGEEYPNVLAAVIAGLGALVVHFADDIDEMRPEVPDLLTRLSPILRNRNEKVQEKVITVIGAIAETAPERGSAKEWMRIVNLLVDLLNAPRKPIRKAAVAAFGVISRAVGPQDILATLLDNLRLQDRSLRVCSTVAIAVVAENCNPYTVLPSLLNEYRVREMNVQNGVLKALAFLFEYVGETARDYAYSTGTLLEDALSDPDHVHRQHACVAVKHLALALRGFGYEDLLIHFLNFIMPNVFETSRHVINAVLEVIDAMGKAIGPGRVLLYLLQGMFHPARKVREVYWDLYNAQVVAQPHALLPYYPPGPQQPGGEETVYAVPALQFFL
eukprot:Clim_evm141s157 gene=Clim_evmTU141s157